MTASSTPQNVLFAATPAVPTSDAFAALVRALVPEKRVQTQGVKGAARGYVLAKLSRSLKAPLICVTEDEEGADQLAGDLSLFFGGEGSLLEPCVLRLPGDDVLPDEEVTADMDVVSRRLGALFHMRQGTRFSALVLSARALAQKVVPPDTLNSLSELIGAGQDIHRDAFARRLVEMGYHAAPLVEDVGTFSVRGDIVDVFSPLYTRPVRLDLFGDTIESIRAFDPETQRTTDSLETLYLPPARELLLSESTRPRMEAALREVAERLNLPTTQLRERLEQLHSGVHASAFRALLPALFQPGLATVLDYVPFWNKAPIVYLDAPVAIERAWTDLWNAADRAHTSSIEQQEPSLPPSAHFASAADLTALLSTYRTLEGGGLSLAKDAAPVVFGFGTTQDLREAIRSHHGEEGALQPLVDRLVRWRDARIAAVVACGSAGQVDRLKRLLLERDISARVHAEMPVDPGSLFSPDTLAHLVVGEASSGFVDGTGGLVLLTDEEIFGARARRKATRSRRMAPFEAAFRDLKEGELIVHTDFGIGRYLGMTTMVVNKLPGEFLVLEYAGKDKVYLPVSRMRLIQKFTGGDPDKVALDRLGTQSWEKTKKRVKENLLKMAAELVQLYAARKAHPGHVFSAPDRYFHQFEADFEFEETPDQAKAIADVIADMQKSEPMDRLVCGDVGYGKTEVAMRAAFKAALDKKQVAVLVPTTVLAQQHFHTFQRRFRDYPVTVDVVSGMRKPQEVRDVLQRAREGKVDIVVGTHKLLSPEVAFKDLGLLVVDEEQRFGVKQKEQIKRLRTQVDVLTLTATPIPRTLNMAMSGLRDLSIIATPPEDRRAIRTFVQKFDPGVIREALSRELARGGQAFFVHNRVDSIASMEQFLKELLPNVSIGVAHGQMPEGELEKVMLAFVEKKHQVLLCTSIIESGLDIPSANTMVVNRADTFGLA
ncbi:MAG: transcription-repair coupling factor, partial [Myxococcaceae bacterium]